MARSGSISGHVYDESGKPIGYASIYAFSDAHPGNGANTQPDGSYTIQGLPSGNYKVQVTASGRASQFYNRAADASAAAQVTVNAPNDTPGIDFALSPASE